MKAAFQSFIAAGEGDQRGLFLTTASNLGTTVQNIEKDFWVCWTLDCLFNQLKAGGPRLLFKGGTSLSKAYGLISRFSEDIDVTVYRDDLGEPASIEALAGLSKAKRQKRLESIKAACQTYIDTKLRPELEALGKEAIKAAGKNPDSFRVTLDASDDDKQSLLIHYPTVLERQTYIEPSVKIESGARSALDPNSPRTITPYLASDLPNKEKFAVEGVRTIEAERTFLDKILILHGMNYFFEAKGQLRGSGRMSRHYYDLHQLMSSTVGATACSNAALVDDCTQHEVLFFARNNAGQEYAKRGSFRLQPVKAMLDPLRRDYEAMSTMIFGDIPKFDVVLESVARAEAKLNSP